MTNPNIDNELFELCKEVYDRFPEWNDADFWYSENGENKLYYPEWVRKKDPRRNQPKYLTANGLPDMKNNFANWDIPLYTSDYLLEKLPKFSPFAKDAYLTVMEKQTPKDKREDFYWTAGYFSGLGWGHTGQSDTPLKSLLRLVIALDDAGVKL